MMPLPQCTCWLRHLLILSSGGPWQRRRAALPALKQPLWFLPNLKEPVCVLLYTTGSFQNSMCVFFSFCWCLSDVSALVFLRHHLRLPPRAHSALVFTLSSPPGTASSFTAPQWCRQVPTSWAARYSSLASGAPFDDCWGSLAESPFAQQARWRCAVGGWGGGGAPAGG